jgi:hypothetical protein
MLLHEFQKELSRCNEAFGKSNFSEARADMIWSYVKDLSGHQMKRIVDNFIASSRQAPLPQDFLKATYEEKKRTYFGDKAKDAEQQMQEYKINCERCFETGLVFTKDETLPSPLLMRCSCASGAEAFEIDIPQWTPEIGQVFVRQPFPLKHFIPSSNSGDLNLAIEGLADRWSAKKKFSAEFWRHQIEQAKRRTP